MKFSASDFAYVLFGSQMAWNVKYLHDNLLRSSQFLPELHSRFFWLDIGMFGVHTLITFPIIMYAWYLERKDNDQKP